MVPQFAFHRRRFNRFLLKKGPNPDWTFALIYESSWKHDPRKKRLGFHQGFRRRGAEYSCTGYPRTKAAALAFHKVCSAIK